MLPKADLEKNKSHVLLELARSKETSKDFLYQTQKMLYQIKALAASSKILARFFSVSPIYLSTMRERSTR